ncbi:MAG: 16S rRNA pseudouridine(516) synthase, partial [Succinivibrio sp.]|nr:16S rRNA pseudouridine(516) synthase [Succinivibrio sp.]
KLIKAGEVEVNGEIVLDPASKISVTDEIVIDGYEVEASDGFKKRVFMLNKPSGYVCADKDNNNPVVINIFSDIPKFTQMHCVGRLDIDTTGLLLVTDDGDLNHRITSPKSEVTKTYLVSTRDKIVPKDVELFKKGLKHPEEKTRYKSALLEILSDHEALVTVTEGRFHEVKRLFECVDNEVTELKRLYIGQLKLDDSLEEGEYIPLEDEDLQKVFTPYSPE